MNEGSTASVAQIVHRCILNTFSSLVVTLVGKKAMQDIDHRREIIYCSGRSFNPE